MVIKWETSQKKICELLPDVRDSWEIVQAAEIGSHVRLYVRVIDETADYVGTAATVYEWKGTRNYKEIQGPFLETLAYPTAKAAARKIKEMLLEHVSWIKDQLTSK